MIRSYFSRQIFNLWVTLVGPRLPFYSVRFLGGLSGDSPQLNIHIAASYGHFVYMLRDPKTDLTFPRRSGRTRCTSSQSRSPFHTLTKWPYTSLRHGRNIYVFSMMWSPNTCTPLPVVYSINFQHGATSFDQINNHGTRKNSTDVLHEMHVTNSALP